MLSVQEGISYELNYIKTQSMLRKSYNTHLFFHRKNTAIFHGFSTGKAALYTTEGRIATNIEKLLVFLV